MMPLVNCLKIKQNKLIFKILTTKRIEIEYIISPDEIIIINPSNNISYSSNELMHNGIFVAMIFRYLLYIENFTIVNSIIDVLFGNQNIEYLKDEIKKEFRC